MNQPIKTALITGVSTGIGYSIAESLQHTGWLVYGTVRNTSDLEKLQNQWGESFIGLVLDVCQVADEMAMALKPLTNQLGDRKLDALIHNAGVAHGGPLVFQEESSIRQIFETNVLGIWKLTRLLYPHLGEGSRILMMSSVSGRVVTPFVGAYAASKFALEALTDAYRVELGMLGIKVISIQPGPVKTPIWQKARQIQISTSGTPYDHLLALQEKFIANAERNGLETEAVVRVVRRALRAPHPRTRYLVTNKAWLIKLAGWLPDKWKDRLIMMRFR